MSWTSRRAIPVLLAAATLLPLSALGWLAVRLLQQERDIDAQRRRESLSYAAGRLALALEGKIAGIEEQLAQGHGITLRPEGLDPRGVSPVLYQPASASGRNLPASLFAEAQILEFQRQDLPAAAGTTCALPNRPTRPSARPRWFVSEAC